MQTPLGSVVASRRRQWAVTAAATLASTYALDAVAAGFGVALVASGLLMSLTPAQTLVFLLASYLAWGAGLHANLGMNADLLAQNGVSSSLLSKLAHDLVAARSGTIRARRAAAGAGYVATELAKEAPYYAGAIATAMVSDAVAAPEVILFLGGANFGAAAYEWTLARSTRSLLVRLRPKAGASFEADWDPRRYLQDYYSDLGPDEEKTIDFLVRKMPLTAPNQPILFAGVGPTLHHVFCAAERASELHLADYLPGNLDEIRDWIDRRPGAHDWTPFIRHTLEREGRMVTAQGIGLRADLVRAKTSELLHLDLRKPCPLDRPTTYATVVSAFCADSATGDKAEWRAFMDRLATLVGPGGTLLVAALHRSRGYRVGGKEFPSADVSEQDLCRQLERSFHRDNVFVERVSLPDGRNRGYAGILLGCGLHRRTG